MPNADEPTIQVTIPVMTLLHLYEGCQTAVIDLQDQIESFMDPVLDKSDIDEANESLTKYKEAMKVVEDFLDFLR